MAKVIDILPKKHIYDIDYCAGCGGLIEDYYTEVVLPIDDDTKKHIALCDGCDSESRSEGVI